MAKIGPLIETISIHAKVCSNRKADKIAQQGFSFIEIVQDEDFLLLKWYKTRTIIDVLIQVSRKTNVTDIKLL